MLFLACYCRLEEEEYPMDRNDQLPIPQAHIFLEARQGAIGLENLQFLIFNAQGLRCGLPDA